MKRIALIIMLCVFSTYSFSQQPPVNEHDQVLRLKGVADSLLKKFQQTENESLGCSGDLASSQGKLAEAESRIKELEKELADLKKKPEDAKPN